MKAMIFAAGLGTRLRPLTDIVPKALVTVGNMTLLEYAIRKLMYYGFNEIIINVHHFPDMIVEYLKLNHNFGATITISDERDLLLDTGGGLKKAASFFTGSEPLLLYNVDIVSEINLGKLYEFHLHHGSLCTLAVRDRETSRYFLFDDKNLLCGWWNKKTGEKKIARNTVVQIPRAFSGIHIVNPAALTLLSETNVFSLVDFYLQIAATQNILAFEHTADSWTDVGKLQTLEDMRDADLSRFL